MDAAGVDLGSRHDAALFGEAGARVVVSVTADQVAALAAVALDAGVPVAPLGVSGGGRIRLGQGGIDVSVEEATQAFRTALPRSLEG